MLAKDGIRCNRVDLGERVEYLNKWGKEKESLVLTRLQYRWGSRNHICYSNGPVEIALDEESSTIKANFAYEIFKEEVVLAELE